jgi:hypothetical protein
MLGVYLMSTVALFPQSRAAIVLAVVGGILAIAFAAASPLFPNALAAAAATGFLLGLSAFIVTDGPFIDGDRGSVGVFMLACAVAPRVRSFVAGEAVH